MDTRTGGVGTIIIPDLRHYLLLKLLALRGLHKTDVILGHVLRHEGEAENLRTGFGRFFGAQKAPEYDTPMKETL